MKKNRIVLIVAASAVMLSIIIGGILFAVFHNANNWGEWIITLQPTCEETGVQQRTNSKGEVETQVIPALGHNYDIHVNEPACTRDGFSVYTCLRCDSKHISDFKNALGHTYGDWVTKKAASCASSGYEEHACLLCGELDHRTVKAMGHSYSPILTEKKASVIYVTYACDTCNKIVELKEGESLPEFIGNDLLFDVQPSFSFNIKTTEDETYIRNNLKITDTYFYNTEYEGCEGINIPYTLKKVTGSLHDVESVWEVTPMADYEFDSTYTVSLSGELAFEEYSGEELTFTIAEEENHENELAYQDGIVFLKTLENTSPGYYPFLVTAPENSSFLYVTVGKADGIKPGQILCVGEVTSVEEITSETECDFGKVDSIYPLETGEWMIILSEPDIVEIFSVLDISYEEIIDLESGNVDVEKVKTELVNTLYTSDDFVQFLSSVNVASKVYAAKHNLDVSSLATVKDFMKLVSITPSVQFQGNKLLGNIMGELKIPLKNANKNEIGNIVVSFAFDVESEFKIDVSYHLKKKWKIPYKITYFDVGVTQTDTIGFEFDISIDVDHSLEEGKYIQNTESGKIHRKGCIHIDNVKDTSKLKDVSAENAEKQIRENPTRECGNCHPTQEFNYDLLVLQKDRKVIHAYNCPHAAQIAEKNREISTEKEATLIEQGYTCCDWCHPEEREEKNYKQIVLDSLNYADWQNVMTDIARWAKDSGYEESTRSEKKITGVDIHIYGPISASVDIYFVLDFDIEASVTYMYEYTQTNRYGMRLQNGHPVAYTTKTSRTLANELALMGKCQVRVGMLVDTNINISGLKKWVRAGITAEVGAYADAYGILQLSFIENDRDENYSAAYFEAGIYLDVEAYYKLIKWSNSLDIYSDKWPIVRLGYDKAYYGYANPVDTLNIELSYDIEDLLEVKYFELKGLSTGQEKLKLDGIDGVYDITASLKKGTYFSIVDGRILEAGNAPCYFEDTLTIRVIGESDWKHYVKGASVFCIQEYIIKLTGSGDAHSYSDGICSICGKGDDGTTATEQEWREAFAYFANKDANYTVKRYSTTNDTRNNATFFVDGEKYRKHTSAQEMYCQKTSSSSYILTYQDETGTTYDVTTSFGYDGDNDFITYSAFADAYSDFRYDSDKGVYIYQFGESRIEVRLKYKKPQSIVLVHDGMHLIYEFSDFETTSVEMPAIEMDEHYIYLKNEDSTWKIATCISAQGYVVIPSTYRGAFVTVIGKDVFYGKNSITGVSIPGSVKIIEDHAFAFSSITSVTMQEGVKQIGVGAFYSTKLQSVVLPNSVESIGSQAFSCNEALIYNVKDNINYLGNSENPYLYACGLAEDWNYNITSVTLSADCKFVANRALTNEYIAEIKVENGNQYFSSYNGVLLDKNKTVVISAPRVAMGEFVVPSSVKRIAEYAFDGCAYSKVVLPNGLESIGKYAFSGSGITSIVIGNSVTQIEESTFEGCGQLVSVTIGDKVSAIGERAFSRCGSLYNVTFSNKGNLKSIGSWAFEECTCLETLLLPEGLETLGAQFARESDNLKHLSVPESILQLDDTNFFYLRSLECNLSGGVKYLGNSKTPYLIAIDWEESDKQSRVVIENSCKHIASFVFEYNEDIDTVVLGKNVKYIGEGAFRGCEKIKVIYNLSNLKLELGSDEFGGIAKYASVVYTTLNTQSPLKQTNDGFKYYVQDDICHIYDYVGESSNITIPVSIGGKKCKILAGAFQNNSTIVAVSIPAGAELSQGMFSGCKNLKTVSIAGSVSVIPAEMFRFCDSLTDVTLPQQVTTIEREAFYRCYSLREFIVPKCVTSIEQDAFYGCTALNVITNNSALVLSAGADSYGYIAHYAKVIQGTGSQTSPKYKDSLGLLYYLKNGQYVLYAYEGTEENLILPQTVKGKTYTIMDGAFANNLIIKSVVLPSGLQNIPENMFSGCTNLEQITIPNTLKIINRDAFSGCSSLKTVAFEGQNSVQTLGEQAFWGCSALESIVLPNSVTEIEEYCFYACTALKQVNLPSGLKNLGMCAFYGCCALKEIVIPDSVNALQFATFRDCHNLRKITIGRGVKTIGEDSFYDCFRLTEVINLSSAAFPGVCHDLTRTYYNTEFVYSVDDGVNRFVTTSDGFVFYYTNTGNSMEYFLIGYEGNKTEITLPKDVNGYAYSISAMAFAEDIWEDCCGGITSVVIPDGAVISIYSGAFASCDQLKTITLGSGIVRIDSDAFSGCSALKTLRIPEGVQHFPKISHSSSLTELYIPKSTISVWYYALYDCPSLTKIHYSGTVEEWKSIVQTAYWYGGCPIREIICSNGTIYSN